jgi:hypothetical protein
MVCHDADVIRLTGPTTDGVNEFYEPSLLLAADPE